MKFLLFFLLLIPSISFACLTRIPESIVLAMTMGQSVVGKDCSELPGEDCLCADGFDLAGSDLVDEYVNGDAIWSAKEKVIDCESSESCELLRDTHCSDLETGYQFFYAENLILPGYEAYCTKITGYEQVATGKKIIRNNPTKLAQIQAAKAAQAVIANIEASGKKAREACQSVIDLVTGFNLSSANGSQAANQMTAQFGTALSMLDPCRPGRAKYEIQQIPVDGVLITEQLKSLVLSKLSAYEAVAP